MCGWRELICCVAPVTGFVASEVRYRSVPLLEGARLLCSISCWFCSIRSVLLERDLICYVASVCYQCLEVCHYWRDLICYVGSATGFAPSAPRFPHSFSLYKCIYYQHTHICAVNIYTQNGKMRKVISELSWCAGAGLCTIQIASYCLHVFEHSRT